MNQKEIQEHLTKEALKRIVDNSPNYTEQIKQNLKTSSTQETHRKRSFKQHCFTLQPCI